MQLIARFLVVAAVFTISANAFAALPGSGTEADPWRIESRADFDEFAADSSYWAGHTRLDTDIDLAGTVYDRAVIAPDTDRSVADFQGTPFTGFFDGHSYKLINLRFSYSYNWGLFGLIGSSGTVRNLHLENVDGTGYSRAGGLCSINEGAIKSCYVSGRIEGSNQVGGICGINRGTILESSAQCTVRGRLSEAGGICGKNDGGTIKACYALGDVEGGEKVGGLCGGNYYGSTNGIIVDSYASGDVVGESNVGGLCGANGDYIKNCFASGNVKGLLKVGGLCGLNAGSITGSYATGKVETDEIAGGLCGVNNGNLRACYSTGTVTGTVDIGGLCGQHNGYPISDCFWDVETSGITTSAGGIGKSTAEMKSLATYFESVWWEFADFETGLSGWYLPEGDYPKFAWQNTDAAEVTDVTGLTLAQAQTKLAEAGLTVGSTQYVGSMTIEPDIVAGVSASIKGYVSKSLPIDIYVSSGSNGDGSQANPYELACQADLDSVIDFAACYMMTADVFMENGFRYPDPVLNDQFAGHFYGNSYKIHNLDMNTDYGGLFSSIDSSGVVKDLSLAACRIGWETVGGVCSVNWGVIENCYVSGTIRGNVLGGLCRANAGVIRNCAASVKMTSYETYAGGICGTNYGEIEDSYVEGQIECKPRTNEIGGLCMRNEGSIINCFSAVALANGLEMGGLCTSDNGTVTGSFWDVEASGITTSAGGVGLTTAEMQMRATFTDAGWDFVGEDANGTEDVWRICVDGVDYPGLWWEFASGDFACPDGVSFSDYALLADTWLLSKGQPGFDGRCDLDANGTVGLPDLRVFAENWLDD
ncbi:GLUG domain protein [Anaerohalosphaera lusitana]|uniref:GLUG domain protein n=1 Tax=Anaerohalosphaera lusitana TaxID=1936003 RepID=A0A1U9NI00_9BACT|nr:PASTA domain-containing protein [Anaerohalosphaera lusitana]AQT67397.1 GLUG domain protein [Anaerohalosphaera lusitana]